LATFSVTTTADQDAAVKRIVDAQNAQQPNNPLTPLQYVRDLLAHWLDARVAEMKSDDQLTKAQLYAKATDTDKATIDSILAKYQV
jgi:hypothetical protein